MGSRSRTYYATLGGWGLLEWGNKSLAGSLNAALNAVTTKKNK